MIQMCIYRRESDIGGGGRQYTQSHQAAHFIQNITTHNFGANLEPKWIIT